MLCDVVADVLVLPGHGHDVDEGVPRLLPHVAVAVQEPHQQREHQEVATGVRGGRGGGRVVVADGGVRVEEEAEQVEVLHEAHAELVEEDDEVELGVGGAAEAARGVVVLAAAAVAVELVEEVDERPDEGLVRQQRLRLRRPEERLVEDELLVAELVGVLGVDLKTDTYSFMDVP